MKTLKVERRFTRIERTLDKINVYAQDFEICEDDNGDLHKFLLYPETCDIVPIMSFTYNQALDNYVMITMTTECLDDVIHMLNNHITEDKTIYLVEDK